MLGWGHPRVFSQPFKHTYDLVEVFTPDGTPGKYHADLAEYAPDLMVISR